MWQKRCYKCLNLGQVSDSIPILDILDAENFRFLMDIQNTKDLSGTFRSSRGGLGVERLLQTRNDSALVDQSPVGHGTVCLS